MVNKKIKQNRYKSTAKEHETKIIASPPVSFDVYVKIAAFIAVLSLLSLSSIFIYDFFTQSDYLKIRQIEIKGINKVQNNEIIKLADITDKDNMLSVNLFAVKKRIGSHPWINSLSIKREFPSKIIISIIEETPLAIVKIENVAKILINTTGRPFKEYDPDTDNTLNLPIVSGIELRKENENYLFEGTLFSSIMGLLNNKNFTEIQMIKGDVKTGISIEITNIFNKGPNIDGSTINLKLGFDDFEKKIMQAKKIAAYVNNNFINKRICSMDLFSMENIFIKTEEKDALHNNLEKGV